MSVPQARNYMLPGSPAVSRIRPELCLLGDVLIKRFAPEFLRLEYQMRWN